MNRPEIVLIVLVLIVILIAGCKSTRKYDWLATECAPKNFPMQIIEASLHCPNGYIQPVPKGKIISKGWGQFVSIHIVGSQYKPVPNKLNITWFSYREDKFYSGDFELPYEKLKQLFKEGFLDDNGKIEIYHRIMIGVAPQGYVSIWLTGSNNIIKVATFEAKETEVPWKAVLENPSIERKSFIKTTIERHAERASLPVDDKTPLNRWKEYEKEINWKLEIDTPGEVDNALIKYVNGELIYLDYHSKHPKNVELLERQKHPIPKYIQYYWFSESGEADARTIKISENEIYEAFKELGEDNEPITILVQLSKPKITTKIFLKKGEKSIRIKGLDETRAHIDQTKAKERRNSK